ncbi:MAG TPA: hypothetical protein PKM34_07935 [Bacteroidales bacterium]|jgi:hypothetical protein|nr:hypothetical protein [Bacteroidales bacterium]HNQ83557.1 hypothetical protein [Bacteroidales bacterium]HPI87384.1 hypothetical protein [Bacteroidales bacterium]HPM93033.1 hypothetical protein [Bacteroidales bacterium]
MKNDRLENRMRMQHNKEKISDEKLLMGATCDKFPVVMDNGKTIVYITDKSKEAETRLRYELLKKSRFPMQSDFK